MKDAVFHMYHLQKINKINEDTVQQNTAVLMQLWLQETESSLNVTITQLLKKIPGLSWKLKVH